MNRRLICILLMLSGFSAAFGLEFGDNRVQGADRGEYPSKDAALSAEEELTPTEFIVVDGQRVQLEDGLDLRGKNLAGIKINNRTLADVDFSGAKLNNADFSKTQFLNCSFRNALLEGVNTENTTFDGCDFTDARLLNNSKLAITREQFVSARNVKKRRSLVHFHAPSNLMPNYTSNVDYSSFTLREAFNLDAEGGTFTDVELYQRCSFVNMTKEQLISTWNYKKRELDSLELDNAKEEKISLSGLELSNFRIRYLSLTNYDVTDVDFSDAIFWEGLRLHRCSGVTKEQLQSTWNWKNRRFDFDLSSVEPELDWSNMDFSGFTFSSGSCLSGNVADADFTDAKFLVDHRLDSSPNRLKKTLALEHCQGLTLEQVKSTWNYKTGNMEGVVLPGEVQQQLDAEKTTAASF
jgi:uncharacterized protein YjbI with pentapeptide repeats